jgi:hypothetical protein
MTEAEVQLGKGLELLTSLHANDWRWQQELDLLTALSSAQIATKGYSAPDVGKTCTRASAQYARSDRNKAGPRLVSRQTSSMGFFCARHRRADNHRSKTPPARITRMTEDDDEGHHAGGPAGRRN